MCMSHDKLYALFPFKGRCSDKIMLCVTTGTEREHRRNLKSWNNTIKTHPHTNLCFFSYFTLTRCRTSDVTFVPSCATTLRREMCDTIWLTTNSAFTYKQKYWSHAITGALPHPISASHTRAHTPTVYQFPAKRLKCSLLECMLDDETNMQLIIFSCDPWRTSVYEIIFFSCKRHEYC